MTYNPYDLSSGDRIGELRVGKNSGQNKAVGMNPYTGEPGKLKKKNRRRNNKNKR